MLRVSKYRAQRKINPAFWCLMSSLCLPGYARAQPEAPILQPMQLSKMDALTYFDQIKRARALSAKEDWKQAEPLLEQLTQAYPFDGLTWRALGEARSHQGNFRGAADAFVEADRRGLPDRADENAANAARAFALSGNRASAIAWLRIALLQYTFRERASLLADPAFDGERSSADFRALSGDSAVAKSGSRTAKLQADLDYYLKQYETFRFPKLTRKEIDSVRAAAADLRKRMASLSDDEVVVEFQRLSATAPGGHNTLSHLGKGIGGVQLYSLPIDLYEFPEGLFVVRSVDPRYDRLVGTQVTAFGAIPTAEMSLRVAPLIDRDAGADGVLISRLPHFLGEIHVLHDLGATNDAKSVSMTFEKGGKREVVSIEGVPDRGWPDLVPPLAGKTPPPLALAHLDKNYWFTDLPNNSVYVQFNAVIDMQDQSLPAFGIALRKHLQDVGANNLIVDARFNGGGNTFQYIELLRTLIAFDAEAGHTLYYVQGRTTFSAAGNFTTEVRTLTHAIIVGEPASSPRAAGDPVFVTLPNTGIEVRFSTDTWSLYYPDDTRRWVSPDLPITLSVADYFANTDPVLATIQSAIATGAGRSGGDSAAAQPKAR